jgi:eukaryotic-like serine/threonine-protein kinase
LPQTEDMDDFEGGSGPAAGDGAERLPLVPGFTVVRLLGRGGSAAVWLVADNITGEEFALKVLAADAAVCHEQQREIAFLGRYRHDHLIRVHRMLETDQGPGLLMDVASGDSLARLISARGPLPVGEVITLLTPIAQALEYLHSQGVTHADVAPGNVLFTAQGKPLLSDLGMGRIVGEVRGSRQGTPGFIDPAGDASAEGEAGRQHPEADVFALGALGWFALTGRVPAATQQRPPLSVLVPDVPGELMALIESALQEDRSARPSAAEFAYSVFRTGQAAPLDLVAAVHPAVLPELVTRRAALEQKRSRLPMKRGLLKRRRKQEGRQSLGAKDPAAGSRGPRRDPGPDSRRDCGRGGSGTGAAAVRRILAGHGAVAVSAAALVAVLAVALAPRVVQSVTAQEPAATATAVRSHPPADGGSGTGGEPAAGTDADTDNGPDAGTDQLPAAELPPEVAAALAGADPAAAVQALAAVRAQAFRTGSFGLLEQVNTAGSEAMQADRGIARQLEESGHVLAGLRMSVADIRPGPAGEDGRIPVAAVATTSGFTEVDAAGNPARTKVDSTVQHLEFVLQQVAGSWRISEVRQQPAP